MRAEGEKWLSRRLKSFRMDSNEGRRALNWVTSEHYQIDLMASLTAGKKASHKQSKFQRRWQRVERLKAENKRFAEELEALVNRLRETVEPVEREVATVDKQLVSKLLTLGQRKSLANWQREVLDEWIRELISAMDSFGLMDQTLLDDMARYEAFRFGVELENEEGTRPYLQMKAFFENEQQDAEEQIQRDQQEVAETREEIEQHMFAQFEIEVENVLDEYLGPAPVIPDQRGKTVDMLQPELDDAHERVAAEYEQKRASLREELLAEMKREAKLALDASFSDPDDELESGFASDPDFQFDEDFDPDFDFDKNNSVKSAERAKPKITNETFQRMFRATAARLHPDREPDPVERNKKQTLMAELLRARKKGDLITVFGMYQQYAGGDGQFSKADEKQLLAALEDQIEELEQEKQECIYQSGLHGMAYKRFYNRSRKKVDQAFSEHLKLTTINKRQSEQMVKQIRSLKTLTPWLELRYEERDEHAMFMDILDSDDFPEGPFGKQW